MDEEKIEKITRLRPKKDELLEIEIKIMDMCSNHILGGKAEIRTNDVIAMLSKVLNVYMLKRAIEQLGLRDREEYETTLIRYYHKLTNIGVDTFAEMVKHYEK